MKLYLIVALGITTLTAASFAENYHAKTQGQMDQLESLEPTRTPAPSSRDTRRLNSSASPEDDINHYQNMDRRLGFDLGMFIPQGDFQNSFSTAPMLGLHYNWEAIYPFAFTLGVERTSATDKNNAANSKLTVSSFNIGTKASFPVGRVTPYIKVEGAFYFNDLSFGGALNSAPKYIVAGNDTLMTTVGVNAGIGIDFVVGRELAMGIDATYHYPIPKELTLSDSSQFNLGSPYATVSIHLNF